MSEWNHDTPMTHEVENGFVWKVITIEGPIFDFHDYGRKFEPCLFSKTPLNLLWFYSVYPYLKPTCLPERMRSQRKYCISFQQTILKYQLAGFMEISFEICLLFWLFSTCGSYQVEFCSAGCDLISHPLGTWTKNTQGDDWCFSPVVSWETISHDARLQHRW